MAPPEFLPTFLKPYIGVWRTPQVLAIQDERLGIIDLVLKILAIFYPIYIIFVAENFYLISEPGGFPTVWFESGSMPQAQTAPAPSYCSDGTYDWNYDTLGDTGFWNEKNISCITADYGDMIEVASRSVMVYTYMKRSHGVHFPCSIGSTGCATTPGNSILGSRVQRDESRLLTSSGQQVCSCAKQQDSIIMGADAMVLVVNHAFTTDGQMGYVAGETSNADAEGKNRAIKTCVRKPNPSDECSSQPLNHDDETLKKCCLYVFKPGEEMRKTVAEWMAASGDSLDERLRKGASPDPTTGNPSSGKRPYRRVSGTKLQFNLRYYGIMGGMFNDGDNTVTCELEIVNQEGWTSAGSKSIYKNFNTFDDTEYFDYYKRGIRFQFLAAGIVRKFDWITLANSIVAGLVFVGLSNVLTGLVAFYVLPQKDVYKKAQKMDLDYGHELASFGVRAAIACQAFKSWNTPGEEDGEISREEFAQVFVEGGNFKKERAMKFAQVVLNEASEDATKGMTCKELIGVIGGGLVSMENLEKFADESVSDETRSSVRMFNSQHGQKSEVKPTGNGNKVMAWPMD